MKKQLLAFVLISFVLFNIGCKKAPTEPNATATLTVEDVSCTEAWVKVTSANFQNPSSLILFVDDMPNQTLTLVSSDTLLYVDSLLPNRSYKIKATFAANNRQQTTNEVVAKTMDTTSHNFSWQTFTFGEHSSSVLYDVAIIDENNIWAVGEIYMNDSLGNPDPNAYNAAHWDGQSFELKRIYTYSACNAVDYAPLKAIFAFSETNMIVTSGGSIGWFNGRTNKPDCSIRTLLTGSINKMWGTSNNDLYVVGNGGNIIHYDGISWKKIESGTATNIYDVYGITDKNGSQRIFCAVSDFETTLKGILEISNNQINTLTSNIFGNIYTAWALNTNQLFAGGHGLFKYRNNVWTKVNIDASLIYRIRGDAVNNIFAVGGSGLITHFNGVNWQNQNVEAGASFKSCNMKGKTIVTVGEKNSKAIIAIGKQN